MTQPTVHSFLGADLTIIQIARLTGFPIHALHRRVVDQGMTTLEAIAEPFPTPTRGQSSPRALARKPKKRLVPYAGQ